MNTVCCNEKILSMGEHAGGALSGICPVVGKNNVGFLFFFYDGRFVETAFFVSLRSGRKTEAKN